MPTLGLNFLAPGATVAQIQLTETARGFAIHFPDLAAAQIALIALGSGGPGPADHDGCLRLTSTSH